ncbi:hypothetical protein ACOSQ4_015708 [Xanthoceras sorbifolium]
MGSCGNHKGIPPYLYHKEIPPGLLPLQVHSPFGPTQPLWMQHCQLWDHVGHYLITPPSTFEATLSSSPPFDSCDANSPWTSVEKSIVVVVALQKQCHDPGPRPWQSCK